jgi:hypothetical protein
MDDSLRHFGHFMGGLIALLGLPIATAGLASTGAEAFTGDKEPMLQTAAGLFIGLVAAVLCGLALPLSAACGGSSKYIVRVVLTVDAIAILASILLIRIAYLFPSHRIEW